MLYNFFDKIYCINLIYRKDRYESAQSTFKKLNISNVEFYFATKSDKGGRYGCFESHINVIKKAYNEGYNNILIFEDDIRPSIFYDEKILDEAITFMKTNNWDIFYLGYFVIDDELKVLKIKNNNKNIFQFNACAAHAYCLNRKSMEKILNVYEKYISYMHVDRFYSIDIFNNYFITPIIFEQYYCYPIDNLIVGILENITRNIQCFTGDYLQLNSLMSFIIYYFNKYNLLIVILIFLILIYLFNTNKINIKM
jgi:GR25 family glycosyltransferase involved in LPS biosynthesis